MITDTIKLDRVCKHINNEILFIDEQLEKVKNNKIKILNEEIGALVNQQNLLYTLSAIIKEKCTTTKEPF